MKKIKIYKSAQHQETCEVLLRILQPELSTCEQCHKEMPLSELSDHLLAHEINKNAVEAPVNRSSSLNRERPNPRNLASQIMEIIQEHSSGNRNFGFRFGIRYGRRSSVPVKPKAKPKPEAAKRLPVSRYQDNGVEVICTICLTKFKRGKRITTLPCFHQFHHRCIDVWLENSCLCPICKASI